MHMPWLAIHSFRLAGVRQSTTMHAYVLYTGDSVLQVGWYEAGTVAVTSGLFMWLVARSGIVEHAALTMGQVTGTEWPGQQ